jgi:hypothetical protein
MFLISGAGQHTGDVLNYLYQNNQGPVSDLLIAYLLKQLGSNATNAVVAFAQKGLNELNLSGFQRDYGNILDNDSGLRDGLIACATALRDLSDAEAHDLFTVLDPDLAAALRQARDALRKAPALPVVDVLRTVFDDGWTTTRLRDRLDQALRATANLPPAK